MNFFLFVFYHGYWKFRLLLFPLDNASLDAGFVPAMGLGGGWLVLTESSVTRWVGLLNSGVHWADPFGSHRKLCSALQISLYWYQRWRVGLHLLLLCLIFQCVQNLGGEEENYFWVSLRTPCHSSRQYIPTIYCVPALCWEPRIKQSNRSAPCLASKLRLLDSDHHVGKIHTYTYDFRELLRFLEGIRGPATGPRIPGWNLFL